MSPRIAIVTHSIGPASGITTITRFLYKVLSDSKRYRPEIICLATSASDEQSVRLLAPSTWWRGVQVKAGRSEGIPYVHVGANLTEFEFQRYRPRPALNRILDGFDLVHVVGGTPAWALSVNECAKPKCLQAATLTSEERKTRLSLEGGLAGAWRRRMGRWTSRLDLEALKHVAIAFVINPLMKTRLSELMDPSRVIYAPPGIDTGFFRPSGYRPDGHILSVARFSDPRKNVRLLTGAYARLKKAVPHAPDLVLAGGPPSRADMEYLAALGVGEHIKFRGEVSDDELRDLYQGACLFVLSSDEEGLGIVILEAMASGLPVVSTRCGGPDSVVLQGETGLLTPVGDVRAMAEAMQGLLEDPELRRQMGEAGRREAEKRFSLEVTGKPFLDTYDELLADGARPGGRPSRA